MFMFVNSKVYVRLIDVFISVLFFFFNERYALTLLLINSFDPSFLETSIFLSQY